MRTSILEDFSGTGMGQHRTDLIQRLDRVLGQLDCGLEYLTQHNPDFTEDDLQKSKGRYRKLREILLRVNTEAINRTPHLMIKTICVLTHALDAHRTSHDIHVCTSSTISIVAGLVFPPPTLFVPPFQYHPPGLLRSLTLFSSSRSLRTDVQ